MTISPRTQLLSLATFTLVTAIASTAWLINSPGGVRRSAEAMVLLMTGIFAFRYCRRLPKGTPLVLGTTLAGLTAALLRFWR